MLIAQWDDSYKTGHATVDKQHEQLFKMVNDLHDAIVAQKSKEVLGPTLKKLATYTVEHFQMEEALMEQLKYPERAAHRAKHEALTKQVKELIEKFESGKAVLSMTLSNFLANWLRHHIKQDDMALIKFAKERPEAMAAKAAG